jgi:hypothetical protein
MDTLDSGYGPGWQRANGFLTHRPNGVFCSLVAFRVLATGSTASWGTRLRVTVLGPGVTPDVAWEAPALPRFDPNDPAHAAVDRETDSVVDTLGDPACKP